MLRYVVSLVCNETPLVERLRVLASLSSSTHLPMVIGLDFMISSSLSVYDSMLRKAKACNLMVILVSLRLCLRALSLVT